MKHDHDIEKMLKIVADTESFEHNDELSELVKSETEDDELSEFEMDMVSAAATSDYEKFKQYLNKNKENK